MQASSWVDGQSRHAGQHESTQPSYLSHNTTRNDNRFENNASHFVSLNNGVGALVGHFTLNNGVMKQVSGQRQNNFLSASNALPTSSRQDCHPNSANNSFHPNYTPNVTINPTYCQQVMPAPTTFLSGRPSAVLSSNAGYYPPQGVIKNALTQNTKSRTENIMAHPTNPTSSSAIQAVYNTQQQSVTSLNQTSVQSHNYSQTSQQTACGSYSLPSYVQAVLQIRKNVVTTNLPSPQNVQVYTVTPETVTQLPTSCLNISVANNQCEQNNHLVSQTNDPDAADPVNGRSTLLSQLLATNNTSNPSISLTSAPVQTHLNSHQTQQPTVRDNRNMQTAESIILSSNGIYSSNVPRPTVMLPSQTRLPETTNSISSLQNISAAPLQTNISACQALNSVSWFYQKNNEASNRNLSQAPQVNRCEAFDKIETVSTFQANDSSMLTSPGRALRAVAVVLPLSQESSSNEHASPKSQPSSNLASAPCFPSSNQLDNIPVLTPDTACLEEKLQHLTGNCNISSVKDSVQAPAISPSLKQKQMSVHDAGPKLPTMSLTFGHLVEGIVNSKFSGRRKSTSGKRKTPAAQVLCEEELSSVPTTEWTLYKLYKKIQEMEYKENEQNKSENDCKKSDYGELEIAKQIIYRFWDGDLKALLNALKKSRLSNEIRSIREFCSEVNLDTVVLSHMKSQNGQPTRYRVLQHDEVYEENSFYTSSWLNINSQLDDIDKEFGFPWFFKYSQECGNNMTAETSSKLEDKSQTGLKPVHPEPEKTITKDDTLNHCSSRSCMDSTHINVDTENHNRLNNNSETAIKPFHSEPETPMMCEENQCSLNEPISQPSDPSYSFKIEVLAPDEAKVIFEQIDCNSPQIVNTAVSEATVSSVLDDQQDDSNKETCHAAAIEMVCCIEKWKENVFGLSSESKCKCKDLSQDKQAQSVNKNDFCWPMETLTVDLTEYGYSTPVLALKELEDRQESKCSNDSNIIVLSESENENEDDHKENFQQDLPKSRESHQVASTDENVFETLQVHGSDVAISEQMLELEDICRIQPEENGTDTPEEKQVETPNAESLSPSTPISPSDEVEEDDAKLKVDDHDLLLPLTSKKLKLSSHLKSQTILESFSKCKNIGPVKSVELALFGSTREKCASASTRRSHLHSSLNLSYKTQQPPRRISVKMNPLKRSEEAEQPGSSISVKRRIHDSWRNSFPSTIIKLRRKHKKFAILSTSPVKPVSPIKLKDLLVNSKRKISDADDSQCHKKRRTRSAGKEEISVNAQVFNNADNSEVRPLQDNVLRFNVLPNTFSFKEGSDNGDTMADSAEDEKTVPGDAKDKQPIIKTKGTWCEESSRKSSPQRPASVTETRSLFQEFQRRYKMSQMATDE